MSVVGGVATLLSLFNTYYIIEQVDNRITTYDDLLKLLQEHFDKIIVKDDFLYILAYTPLLGSISGSPNYYKSFTESIRKYILKYEAVIIMVKDSTKFHTDFLTKKGLIGSNLSEKIAEKNQELLSLNQLCTSTKSNGISNTIIEINNDTFPPYYILCTKTKTVICVLKFEERKGNEIIAICSDDLYYKEFAYELFAHEIAMYNNVNNSIAGFVPVDPKTLFHKITQ